MKNIFGQPEQKQFSAAVYVEIPVYCPKGLPIGYRHRFTNLVLMATDKDQAVGAALRIAKEFFPPSDGYCDHAVCVDETNKLIDIRVEADKDETCYTRCACGSLFHHEDSPEKDMDIKRKSLAMLVHKIHQGGFSFEQVKRSWNAYFPGEVTK